MKFIFRVCLCTHTCQKYIFVAPPSLGEHHRCWYPQQSEVSWSCWARFPCSRALPRQTACGSSVLLGASSTPAHSHSCSQEALFLAGKGKLAFNLGTGILQLWKTSKFCRKRMVPEVWSAGGSLQWGLAGLCLT